MDSRIRDTVQSRIPKDRRISGRFEDVLDFISFILSDTPNVTDRRNMKRLTADIYQAFCVAGGFGVGFFIAYTGARKIRKLFRQRKS